MNKNDIEIRSVNSAFVNDGRKVSGYAIRFNEESVNMGFIETISPEAFSQELLDNSDVFALYNHDDEKVLARSIHGTGSLHLELREDGVWYEFDSPNTYIGDELLEHIKRGEIFASSFAFAVPQDGTGEIWKRDDDETIKRTITKVVWFRDVSPVFEPAYPTTSCSQRALNKVEEMNKELAEQKLKEQEERQKALYDKLDGILADIDKLMKD